MSRTITTLSAGVVLAVASAAPAWANHFPGQPAEKGPGFGNESACLAVLTNPSEDPTNPSQPPAPQAFARVGEVVYAACPSFFP